MLKSHSGVIEMAGSERIENLEPRRADESGSAEFSAQEAGPSLAEKAKQSVRDSKDLAADGKLGQLEIVDPNSTEADEPDSSEHLDVGKTLYWSPESRENARPQKGEGYQQVMQRVGRELLGRPLLVDELKALSGAAKVLQMQRGKNPDELTTSDELLPKNEKELDIFLNALLDANTAKGPLSERQVRELSRNLFEVFQKQMVMPLDGALVYDLKPVKDQKVVTDVVPDAVYIDSSHIEGGQGYRRKENCESETQTYWLSKKTAEALMRVQKSLIEGGHEPLVLRNMNAAGRRALDRELIKKCAPNQPHAKKRSQHEFGISIDVDNYDNANVRKALEREGFVHNVPGDRPHFTYLKK